MAPRKAASTTTPKRASLKHAHSELWKTSYKLESIGRGAPPLHKHVHTVFQPRQVKLLPPPLSAAAPHYGG